MSLMLFGNALIFFFDFLILCLLCKHFELLERATAVRTKSAKILCADIHVDHVPFNRGFYQITITMYIKITEWHTKYVDRAVHDTTYIATHDTIPDPYPVEVKVPRELNWWQKFMMRTGGIALGLLLLWLGWQIWKIYKRRF
mgnify:CR=1 FL=1